MQYIFLVSDETFVMLSIRPIVFVAEPLCFASKATHAELVTDLSTNNFFLYLKRFIGSRDVPQRICYDNATNFVGAQAELNDLNLQFFTN